MISVQLLSLIELLFIFTCVLLFSIESENNQNLMSIFLIGDSVFARLYNEGFKQYYNCGDRDPYIDIEVEHSQSYPFQGLLCAERGVKRVGYSLHFGVSRPPYHPKYHRHEFDNSTNNSRTNILITVQEFIHRLEKSNDNDSAVFMFMSNLWDAKKYLDKLGHPNLKDYLDQYQDDLTTLLIEMKHMLWKKNHQLVLSTMHRVRDVSIVHDFNIRMKYVACYLQIPVFDQYTLLGENMTAYLKDRTHQTATRSIMIAEQYL